MANSTHSGPDGWVPAYLLRGRTFRSPNMPPVERRKDVDASQMNSMMAEVMPEAIYLVCELYSNSDDIELMTMIDSDGASLMDSERLDKHTRELILATMLHDITIKWNREQAYTGSRHRVWSWTRKTGVEFVGPRYDYIWNEKA